MFYFIFIKEATFHLLLKALLSYCKVLQTKLSLKKCNVIIAIIIHKNNVIIFNVIITRSHLVYRYLCSRCNATYYGKTYQHFFSLAAKYMGISNLTGKRVKNVK